MENFSEQNNVAAFFAENVTETYENIGTEGCPLPQKSPKTRIIGILISYLATPLIAIGILLVCMAIYEIYPFGQNMMSSYDMLAQIVPFAEHLFDVFEGNASLFYSFSVAGGADVFGTIVYCLVSPFSFLFLVMGKGQAVYTVSYIIIAKAAFISLSAAFFIRKTFPSIPSPLVLLISLLYTFSGYFHVANTYINWLDFMIYLPIAMYAFRRFIQTGKYLLFSAMIAAMIYTCFSIACFSLLIIFLILFAYVLFCVEKPLKRTLLTKICLSLIVAVGLALPMILPAFFAYLRSGRNTGLFSNMHNALSADHLYYKLSYVLYDSVFVVLGIYYLIVCDKRSGLSKFLFVTTALIFAPVLIDEVCMLLNAGSYMSYSLRFGFLNSALGLYLACLATEKLCKCKNPSGKKAVKIIISCAVSLVLIALCALMLYLTDDIVENRENSFVFTLPAFKEGTLVYKLYDMTEFAKDFSSGFAHSLGGLEIIVPLFAVFALGVTVTTILTGTKIMNKRIAAIVIAVISFMQIGFGAYHTIAGDKNTMITYDQIQVVLDEISKAENGDFLQYRIKDYNNKVSADAPLTLHYRAYSVFSSVIDYTNFAPMNYFNYTGNGINTIKTRGGNIFSDSLLGYKYAYSTGSSIRMENWKSIGSYEPFYLFENITVFPTAFTIPGGELNSEGNYADRLDSLYNWLGGTGNLCNRTGPTDITYDETDDYYVVTLSASKPMAGNTYVVAKLPENVSAKYCDGKIFDEDDYSDLPSDFVLDTGYDYPSQRASRTLAVRFDDKNGNAREILENFEIITVSFSKIKELKEIADEHAVTADFKSDGMSLSFENDGNDYLFINYVALDGYFCKMNGTSVDFTENDLNMIAIELKEGKNDVTLKYTSPYIKYIIIGVLLGAVLVAAAALAYHYLERLKKWMMPLATVLAGGLASVIFGFGFIYPTVIFLIKCVKAAFKI